APIVVARSGITSVCLVRWDCSHTTAIVTIRGIRGASVEVSGHVVQPILASRQWTLDSLRPTLLLERVEDAAGERTALRKYLTRLPRNRRRPFPASHLGVAAPCDDLPCRFAPSSAGSQEPSLPSSAAHDPVLCGGK